MSVLAGPFAITCVLLVVAGAAKAARPGDTAQALVGVGVSIGRRASRALVRSGGAAEAALGVVAAVTGAHGAALLVACSYAAFAAFVAVALARHAPISTCGCFGGVDTPPSVVHVVVDLAAAAIASGAAASGGVALPDVVAAQPLAAVPFVILVALGTYLVFVAFTALPRAWAAAQGG